MPGQEARHQRHAAEARRADEQRRRPRTVVQRQSQAQHEVRREEPQHQPVAAPIDPVHQRIDLCAGESVYLLGWTTELEHRSYGCGNHRLPILSAADPMTVTTSYSPLAL